MENNFIQMAASTGYAMAYTIVQFLNTLSIVCSCISPMTSRILSFKASIVSLACRRNSYLWRHPINDSPTMANRSSEVIKQPTRSVQFLNKFSIVCSCISPMASRILSFKASIVSLACRRNTYLWRPPRNNSPTVSNRSSEVVKWHQLYGW